MHKGYHALAVHGITVMHRDGRLCSAAMGRNVAFYVPLHNATVVVSLSLKVSWAVPVVATVLCALDVHCSVHCLDLLTRLFLQPQAQINTHAELCYASSIADVSKSWRSQIAACCKERADAPSLHRHCPVCSARRPTRRATAVDIQHIAQVVVAWS